MVEVNNMIDFRILVLQSAVVFTLVSLLFFVIRHMIERTDKEIKEIRTDVDKKFKDFHKTRSDMIELYLREDSHTVLCGKARAEFQLHMSTELGKTKDEIMDAM